MAITALTDTQLLEQARDGDEAAFTELYVRHQPAALRVARTYRRFGDPDDLVNGAFERVLGAIRRGAGPTESFRAYLFVTLRRLATEQGSAATEEPIDDVPEPVVAAADAPELEMADRELITRAFETLPDRWQSVLWHTAVEGRQPRDLADVLGVSANAAAAMAYRAREKLRQAYLQAHLSAAPAPDHEPWRSQLGAYVRDGLSARDRAAVDEHLASCESCTALVAELGDVNRTLTRSVVPLFVLVGGGKLAALGAAGAAAAGGGDKGLFAKLRHAAPTVGSTAAIAAVVGGIVGMGSVVAREDGGPTDSAADAADIGDPDGWDGGSGGSGGSGRTTDDSIFGDDDFALSPFDDGFQDDLGVLDRDFGDNFSYDDRFDDLGFGDDGFSDLGDGLGNGRDDGVLPVTGGRSGGTGGNPPRVGAGSAPPPAPAPPAPAPPPGPTPTPPPTRPPTTPTTPPTTQPPAPPELAFTDTSGWTATGPGTGTLLLSVGEVQAGAAISLMDAAAQNETLVLTATLTGGATFAPDGQPAGCTVAGATATCTFTQPAAGAGVSFELRVAGVTGQGQAATAQLHRGGQAEPEAEIGPIELTPYVPALSLTEPTFSRVAGPPAIQADFGVVNSSGAASGPATLTVTVAGDAAFVPAGIDVEAALAAIGRRVNGEPLRALLGAPLPPGCTTDVGDPGDWDGALDGRVALPRTVTCPLGEIAAGATVTVDDVLVLLHPVVYDDDGVPEDATITATLSLDGAELDARTFTVARGSGGVTDAQAATGG